jgi:hypothetical protein
VVRPPEPRATLLDLLLGGPAVRALGRLVQPLDEAASVRVRYSVPW